MSEISIEHFANSHTDVILHNNPSNIYYSLANSKFVHHLYNCYFQIHNSRNLEIPNIKKETNYSTVIIENRNIPAIEYIIRKAVHLLGVKWSHYVACTEQNYELICEICNSIHENINIIKLSYDSIDHNTYNNICLDAKFWEPINAEKILVYQSDCEFNHGGIDKFLKYDYIGAPWPVKQDDNLRGVGNGGFSLRDRQCMLKCLKKQSPAKLTLNRSTKKYIDGLRHLNRPLDCPPEDVYYSKCMIDFNIGSVAPRDVAANFAAETSKPEGSTPLGEHQYWLRDNSSVFENKIIKSYHLTDTKFSEGDTKQHAGGWPDVINNLRSRSVVNHHNGNVQLIDCTEQYFVWESNKPMNLPWVGIVHITPVTPSYLDIANVDTLLNNKNFKKSLKHCVSIVTLSDYLNRYISSRLPDIKVVTIKHPVKLESGENCFDIKNVMSHERLTLTQIGQQMRYMSTIYRINFKGKKQWLTGWEDKQKMKDLLYKEIQWLKLEKINIDEDIIKYLSNPADYYKQIATTICYMHVIDSSANNTILEAMSRNIPIFVNRHPAVEQYLGSHYPLYFTSISHLQYMLSDREQLYDLLYRGSEYLSSINKHDITHGHFAGELLKLIN